MTKLPASMHHKLRAALAPGRIPKTDDPGYDDVFDIWGELWTTIGNAWEDPLQSRTRRHVAALVDLWSAIPPDGLLVGVAVNQPEVVPVAIEAAEAMELPHVRPMLEQISDCIPPEVLFIDDVEDRLSWYQEEEHEPLAERLAELEEEAQDGPFASELMLACLNRTLAEPREFFRA
jgi:hypothetical protein